MTRCNVYPLLPLVTSCSCSCSCSCEFTSQNSRLTTCKFTFLFLILGYSLVIFLFLFLFLFLFTLSFSLREGNISVNVTLFLKLLSQHKYNWLSFYFASSLFFLLYKFFYAVALTFSFGDTHFLSSLQVRPHRLLTGFLFSFTG